MDDFKKIIEKNDINSMDWDHPLRETPEGGIIDNFI